jgi:KTSC domain-containing protein
MPSIAIAAIEYDPERERLTVSFVTGCIYEYVDVPAEVVASFRSAFSKGMFFNSYIRDRYDFRKIAAARAKRTVRHDTGRDRKMAPRQPSSRRSCARWRGQA